LSAKVRNHWYAFLYGLIQRLVDHPMRLHRQHIVFYFIHCTIVDNLVDFINNLQEKIMAKEKVLDEDGMEVDAIYRDDRKRKSLAIDEDTYWKLRQICGKERRTLISQLQLMIEDRYDELFDRDRH